MIKTGQKLPKNVENGRKWSKPPPLLIPPLHPPIYRTKRVPSPRARMSKTVVTPNSNVTPLTPLDAKNHPNRAKTTQIEGSRL